MRSWWQRAIGPLAVMSAGAHAWGSIQELRAGEILHGVTGIVAALMFAATAILLLASLRREERVCEELDLAMLLLQRHDRGDPFGTDR